MSHSATMVACLVDTKLRAEGGVGGAPGARADIPFQSLERTKVEQLFPCRSWKVTLEQIYTLQPMENPMMEQLDIL